MATASEVFRFLAIAHLLLLVVLCVRDHRDDRSALASAAFILTVVAHLALPSLHARQAPLALLHPVLLVGLAVPFALWTLTKVHFEDDCCFRSVHWAILTGLLAVGYVSWLVVEEHRIPLLAATDGQRAFWAVLPKLLSLALVTHALINVYVGGRSDLVVSRLRARYAVLAASGTYILLELLAEAVFFGSGAEARALADRVHDVTTFLLVFGLSAMSLRIEPEVLKPAARPALETAADPALAERLRQLVQVEEVFREEGLTIASLAERLAAQEYRVRQLINAQLGFKNFNAFLHHYRIREAQNALGDPARRHLSVAEIAYAVGYRSLGPFNKAFKEIAGRTPSDYRAQRQAEAPPSPPGTPESPAGAS